MNNVLSVTSTASCLGLRVPWPVKNVRCANLVDSVRSSLRSTAVWQHQRPLSTATPHSKPVNGLQAVSRGRLRAPSHFHGLEKQTILLPRAAYARAARPHKSVPLHHSRKQDTTSTKNGVPIQKQTPSDREFREIFGSTVDRKTGNNLLRVLQAHRIAGTLDQDVNAPGVSQPMITNALTWLRVNQPVDEDAAIIARLDEEERQVQKVYIPQQDPSHAVISGRSALAAIQAQRKKEEAEEAERRAKALTEVTAPANNTTDVALAARRAERAQWVQSYREKATITTGPEPPKMSHWQRLWPSTLFTLAVVGVSVLLAQNYTPPKRSARLFPDLPPAAATILALVNLNFVVFLLWRYPPAWPVLNRYFMMIPGAPRAFSMIGAAFSHQKPMHLVTNMAILWFFGSKCRLASPLTCSVIAK